LICSVYVQYGLVIRICIRNWILIQLCQWIRIQAGKKLSHKKDEKKINFTFWSSGCSLWRVEGFFLQLGSPLWRPTNKYIAIRSTNLIFFQPEFFAHILVIKNLDLDPDSPKCLFLIRIRWECIRNCIPEHLYNYYLSIHMRLLNDYFCVFLVPVWFVYSKMHFLFPFPSDMVLKLLIVV
jgi:hypothetical protein